jgi:hypothetical protein
MHLHNDYAKFMQSDYAKFRQTVVPLRTVVSVTAAGAWVQWPSWLGKASNGADAGVGRRGRAVLQAQGGSQSKTALLARPQGTPPNPFFSKPLQLQSDIIE